jgi:TfoX/Sxy family transcriptional regulator of competence genes
VAYDEQLAERVRDAVADDDLPRLSERKMFGGLAFMIDGHMLVGIVGSELMVRLGPDGAAEALRHEHVREMDFTGRPSRGMVFVAPDGLTGDALNRWVAQARQHVRSLPAKAPSKSITRKRGSRRPVS